MLAIPLLFQGTTVAEAAPSLGSTYVKSTTMSLFGSSVINVSCNPGDFATGGGFNLSGGPGGLSAVLESRPQPVTGTPTGWHVDFGTTTGTGTAFVVCMSPVTIGGVTTSTNVVEVDAFFSPGIYLPGTVTAICSGTDFATGGGFASAGLAVIITSQPAPAVGRPIAWVSSWDVLLASTKAFVVCMTPVTQGGVASTASVAFVKQQLDVVSVGVRVNVGCPAGDFATGGGPAYATDSIFNNKIPTVSQPSPTNGMPPTGWSIEYGDSVTIPPSAILTGGMATAFVVCVHLPPPTLTVSATKADGTVYTGGTWTNQNVIVTFTCTGGVMVSPVPPSVTVSTEGKDQVVTGSCSNALGATATAAFNGIDIDKTAPTTSAAVSPPPNAGGWNNGDVTVTLTSIDGLSGVVLTEYSLDGAGFAPYTVPFGIAAEGTHTVLYRSRDAAGNLESQQTLTVKIDRTAPSITASAVSNGGAYTQGAWTNAHVTVSFTCTDTGGSGVQSVSGPVTILGQGAGQVSPPGSCTDNAGNTSSTKFGPINIDLTPPIITWTTDLGTFVCSNGPCTQDLTYRLFQPVNITCASTKQPPLSPILIDGCIPSLKLGGSCGTGAIPAGVITTVNATTQDSAGNITSATLNVNCLSISSFGLLRSLTLQYVSNQHVAASLVAKIDRAATAFARGDFRAADELLEAYRHQLRSQIGKSISAANAARLIQISLSLGGGLSCSAKGSDDDCDRESGGGDHGHSGPGDRDRSGDGHRVRAGANWRMSS